MRQASASSRSCLSGHTRMAPSAPAAGEQAAAAVDAHGGDGAGVTGEGDRSHLAAAVEVVDQPQAQRLVGAGGHQELAAWLEGQGGDRRLVTLEAWWASVVFAQVRHVDDAVVAAGGQPALVGAEGRGRTRESWATAGALGQLGGLALVDRAEDRARVVAGRDQEVAAAAER